MPSTESEFHTIDTSTYPVNVLRVLALLGDARIVGGCVRDILINAEPKDWDICTPLLPEQVVETLKDLNPVDLSNGHGTISVFIENDVIEVTTLRVDKTTDGRHATVEFVSDYEQDARRRDFTINAMSADSNGRLYDYFYGQMCLSSGHVRFVGDPEERIREDYLRILRYFRFYQRYGHRDSRTNEGEATDQAIRRLVGGLSTISGERIQSEMFKILTEQPFEQVDRTLTYMRDLGILNKIGFSGSERIGYG